MNPLLQVMSPEETTVHLTHGENMPSTNIFVSFEFDRDGDLKNNFYKQAREQTQHRVRNCSLNEAYPDDEWKREARKAIAECDVVVVLIGQDTHNAQGVIVETDIARSLCKPIIQIRPQGRPYNGLPRLEEPIPWKWTTLNAKLDSLLTRS